MNPGELQEKLRASIDRKVKLTYSDGECVVALVQTVDDEGFVYDLDLPANDGQTKFWSAFLDVTNIIEEEPSADTT